jgi:hypothetical protein
MPAPPAAEAVRRPSVAREVVAAIATFVIGALLGLAAVWFFRSR